MEDPYKFAVTAKKYKEHMKSLEGTSLRIKMKSSIEKMIDARAKSNFTPFMRKPGKKRLTESKMMALLGELFPEDPIEDVEEVFSTV